MVTLPGNDVRLLALTVGGALAGSLARHWCDPVWPGTAGSLANTFILTTTAAVLIGLALASTRAALKTVLLAAGGAAGSVSVAATRAALETPAQSAIGVVVFFVGATVGSLLGMSMALYAANHEREERC
jgi:hypothetical protein